MVRRFLFLMLFLAAAIAYPQSWSKSLPGLGTFSSPRLEDLNGDGIRDIIIGAGRLEFQKTDSALLALDGKSGDVIWTVGAKDQIFGSASLLDITGDEIRDVFISGRSAELKAINGATGEIIWEFSRKKAAKTTGEKRWYNFYNPQFIADQNDDGIRDILIANGGDVMKEPYDEDRPPGYLVVIDAMSGGVLSYAEMPDGKETYMSAALVEDGSGDYNILFGTGGETVGGNMYVGKLSQVMQGDLTGAKLLATGKEKGFISPPAWVNINSDNIPDAIAIAVDGRVMAFDGGKYEKLWEVQIEGTEAYSSVGIGYFTDDETPDFFVSFAKGVWPELHYTRQFMVNGQSGEIEFIDSLGFYQTTSPVVADMDGDGFDEVIQCINFHSTENGRRVFKNMLVAVDFQNEKKVQQLTRSMEGHNVASTPWIGDADNNGRLDIVFVHSTNKYRTYTFDGFQINRWDSDIPVNGSPEWGSYMGSDYSGVFRNFNRDLKRYLGRSSSTRPNGLDD